jgi:hypothetical protein
VARAGDRMGTYRILVGGPDVKKPFKDLVIDGRIITKLIFKKWHERGKDWIALAEGKDSWRELVIVGMNLRVP